MGDRDGRLWLALAVYAVIYSVGRFAAEAPGFGENLFNRFAYLLPGVAVIYLAWRAAQGAGLVAEARRAWRLLALAFALIEVGNLLWLIETLLPLGGFNLAHVGWLLYFPVLLAGILSFPRPTPTPGERLQFRIDAAAVLCGGAMPVVYILFSPAVLAVSGRGAALSLAYPLGDLVLLLGVAALALRRREEAARPAYLLLTLGLLVEFGADLTYGARALAGVAPNGAASDVAYMLGWVLRGAAALAQSRRPGPRPLELALEERPAAVSVLPYGFALLGYITLFLGLDGAPAATLRLLVAGAAVLAVLALASQWVTARENVHLLADRALRRTEARFRTLVQNASDVIAVVDEHGHLRYLAPSAEGLLGRPTERLVGQPAAEIVHPEDRLRLRVFLSHTALQPGVSGPVELRLLAADGTQLAMEAVATNLLSDPDIGGLVLTLRDIRERKALEQQLMHRALHDPLTGCANRALFADRLRHARQVAQRNGSRFAVVVTDLDDFKAINDGLGHATGDQVLIELASRLRRVARETDTVARLGGDEFAVLIEEVESEGQAAELAAAILAAANDPGEAAMGDLRLGASVGVALSTPELSEDEVLRQADLALYHAKESGKGRFALFAPGMHSAMLRRHVLEAELRRGIAQEELRLLFQPVVSLKTGQTVGAEALVRWRHAERGLIEPAGFIDLAESSGLIEPLGQWVIGEACRQAAAWNGDGQPPFHVGVNLSVRQLHDPRIVAGVRAALATSGLPAELLVCEITESLLASDPLATAARLRELKATGVRLALDDFGTGYSSLGRLRELPIDVLKIDGAFSRDLATPPGRSLVKAIVYLGKAIGLTTIGEGVEQPEQALALAALGCDLAQGYHFGHPVEAAELTARLAGPGAR